VYLVTLCVFGLSCFFLFFIFLFSAKANFFINFLGFFCTSRTLCPSF
jgi:hypothetical protein